MERQDNQEDFDDADSLLDADADSLPPTGAWTKLSGLKPRQHRSLDEVLGSIQDTLTELKPPKNSRREIHIAWEFIKGLRHEDINSIVQIIDHLPSPDLLTKVKEIETLALQLDMHQQAEFSAGERMNIIKR